MTNPWLSEEDTQAIRKIASELPVFETREQFEQWIDTDRDAAMKFAEMLLKVGEKINDLIEKNPLILLIDEDFLTFARETNMLNSLFSNAFHRKGIPMPEDMQIRVWGKVRRTLDEQRQDYATAAE